MMVSLFGLDPSAYTPSALHQPCRVFPETNCYVDLWIELLHAQGISPETVMAFACTVDFEGDQWTFFKPPPEELRNLHGIEVHEMQLYRDTAEQVLEQLKAGRTMTIEVDSFYLPDTAATAYRKAHVKSSIAVEAIDPAEKRLRYFHGAGHYELSGEDYTGLFRLGAPLSEDMLPPYVELVDFRAGARLEGAELRREVMESLRRQLKRRPRRNPWKEFGIRLAQDLPCLLRGSESDYHAYAFATVRQCGAAFEMAHSFLQWMALPPSPQSGAAADALARQVSGAKTLLFKLARRRAFDPGPAIDLLAEDWNVTMNALERLAMNADRRAA